MREQLAKSLYIIEGCLKNGHVANAQSLLESWPKELSHSEIYAQKKFYGKTLLFNQNYLRGIDYFSYCHRMDPTDLQVACDLALCYFQLGLQSDLELLVSEIVQKLTMQKATIESLEFFNTSVFCSKLLEEIGQVSLALKLLDFEADELISFQMKKMLKIQKLRLNVLLQKNIEVQSLYDQVLSSPDYHSHFEIEREHVLMLAESYLFNFDVAFKRYLQALQQDLSAADNSFFKTEMLEMAILNKRNELLEELGENVETQSEYEKELCKLVRRKLDGRPALNILDLNKLEKKLTRLSLLRLIRASALLFSANLSDLDYVKKVNWHLDKISEKNLKKQFDCVKLKKQSTLNVNLEKRELKIEQTSMTEVPDLLWKLISVLDGGQISLEDLAFELYNEEFNLNHYDRIRMSIYRVNKIMAQQTGLSALFHVSKSHVKLNLELVYV